MGQKIQTEKIMVGGLFALAIVLGLTAKPFAPQPVATESHGGAPTPREKVTALVPEQGTGVKVMKASDWAEQYPNEYKTYVMNDENSEIHDYIAENPYIKTLYE